MTNAIVKVSAFAPVATSKDRAAFDALVELVKSSVSEKSQRIYLDAFKKWAAWCEKNNYHPLDMRPENVTRFLIQDKVGIKTRRRELYILRKAMQFAAIKNDAFERAFRMLKLIKEPKEGATTRERRGQALSAGDADKALVAWKSQKDKRGFIAIRAMAINALLAATGIRCAEAADLRVNDVDFETKTLKVWHGKGDKRRDVAIVGNFALHFLGDWLDVIGRNRVFLFPVAYKKTIGLDVKPSEKSIYRAVKRIEKLTGIRIYTHRWRRSHATWLARMGASLQYIKDQLGHESLSTTSIYTDTVDAEERGRVFKLGFGENLI